MRILVPIDGSKHGQAAVHFVASRSTLVGSAPQIEVLNVQLPVPARAARVVGREVVRSYYDEAAQRALKPARAVLKKAGVEASTAMRVGHAPDEIAAAAARQDSDLIVMGSHGHGAFAGMILGSVTQGVLARSTVPLLVLRGHAVGRADKKEGQPDSLKVGIAVDGSRFGKEAVKYVLRHRALFGAAPQFTLLHVVSDFAGAVMPDMAGIALPALSAAEIKALQARAFDAAVGPVRKQFDKAGVPVQAVALVGNPGDEIAVWAKKNKLDVLVIGSHGYGVFKAALLGSVATRVAAHCETPLLIVKAR
ncbi:MAG: universal stress protein [Betaproteobacteria bacterium]|jgi:nucleotide-binding universal stress UspA family protein|nr:universal stress protein [Burkholderiales bacterium]